MRDEGPAAPSVSLWPSPQKRWPFRIFSFGHVHLNRLVVSSDAERPVEKEGRTPRAGSSPPHPRISAPHVSRTRLPVQPSEGPSLRTDPRQGACLSKGPPGGQNAGQRPSHGPTRCSGPTTCGSRGLRLRDAPGQGLRRRLRFLRKLRNPTRGTARRSFPFPPAPSTAEPRAAAPRGAASGWARVPLESARVTRFLCETSRSIGKPSWKHLPFLRPNNGLCPLDGLLRFLTR